MTYETVLLEEREPGIWLLTINRPKQLNALAPQVLTDMAEATRAVELRGFQRELHDPDQGALLRKLRRVYA